MNKAMEAKEGKFRGRKGRLKTELCRLLTNEAGREKEVKEKVKKGSRHCTISDKAVFQRCCAVLSHCSRV